MKKIIYFMAIIMALFAVSCVSTSTTKTDATVDTIASRLEQIENEIPAALDAVKALPVFAGREAARKELNTLNQEMLKSKEYAEALKSLPTYPKLRAAQIKYNKLDREMGATKEYKAYRELIERQKLLKNEIGK